MDKGRDVIARRQQLGDAELQAAGFGQVRHAHRTEIAEDYVELVADLIDAKGEARAVDLAERLGVSQATVTTQVSKLVREGLLSSEPYRSVFLTTAGRDLAEACRRRHRIVLAFLDAIGVPPEVAHVDAEGIEHHVSDQTLGALEMATRRLTGQG
ncbi:MAG TPA: manganese-binding transcriptional regulator MntR [Geminicoccus sp.]|uniref:manganese-binding transcriptional regulator MntR n=1 Tax=Geminicoccus sp. TaxID=2024832 RepID=UPI002E2F0F12|nr:manganese-binding transcriptional regulator MntR [Geminicoccus sp.]HEX2529271.1 manganese-binding transcriptional regulator MntR [Geminicoccus sp.]